MPLLVALGFLLLLMALLYGGHGWRAWAVTGGLALLLWALSGPASWWALSVTGILLAAALVVFVVPQTRTELVARPVFRLLRRVLPAMSETERVALEAGTVWWDAELFSGRPDWQRLLDVPVAPLDERERAFLDGPVDELCAMLDDHAITTAGDLPESVWAFLKEQGFFGIIIPRAYGGLELSAAAHSAIVTRIASRSVAAAVTVMVPNSLGPGELLVRYGTEAQRERYLPGLARGEEIPCFALTGPENGSDAAAMDAVGVVCEDEWEGERVLGLRLDWSKRYTTLGPRATLIGLAFRLRDPDGLLGGPAERGITCALVPADLPGIEIGERHDPLGVPFLNGPNRGRDVFVPIDAIIGGAARAGDGWRMLMDCLSAGRGLSLPSLATGAAQLCCRFASAYTTVRRQFGLPVSRFEGVQERLARMAGLTYTMDAARALTAAAVDAGEHPAVVSAIVKAWLTEAMRVVVDDAMDVLGGAGISRGPRNPIAPLYQAVPIGITVEGANILTRSMIVFGQGAIRCHPFLRDEMRAVAEGDVDAFDEVLCGHLGHVAELKGRALMLALTRGLLEDVPDTRVPDLYRGLTRLSTGLALCSEAAMATLGGALKRKEALSGRLADALAWLYLGSAALKRYHDDGEPVQDDAVVRWAVEHAMERASGALCGVLDNLPARPAAWGLSALVFPLGDPYGPPSDALCGQLAYGMIHNRRLRERLTHLVHRSPAGEPGLGRVEAAFALALGTAGLREKVRRAVREGRLDRRPAETLLDRAVTSGVLTLEQREDLARADEAARDAVEVDAFASEALAEAAG